MKGVMGNYYVHKSAVDTLPSSMYQLYKKALLFLPTSFADYAIVKVNPKDRSVSFIKSPDWDTENEPTVGDSIKISDDDMSFKRGTGQIYHHKWQFVKNDYDGFDVEASKERSKLYSKQLTRQDLSRIGYRTYWNTVLDRLGIEK